MESFVDDASIVHVHWRLGVPYEETKPSFIGVSDDKTKPPFHWSLRLQNEDSILLEPRIAERSLHFTGVSDYKMTPQFAGVF
jgi:hypothetical protein